MAQALLTDTRLALKYADKDSFSFSKIKPSADDENLYEIAELVNAFQKDPMTQVVKVTTSSIMQ